MSTPVVGFDNKVTITKGTNPEVTLLNSKWKYSGKNKVGEAHNTTDGTRRVKGRSDYSGSVEGFQDLTSSATLLETNISNGDEVTLKLYVSATKFYSIIAIIENLNIDTGVDDVLAWNFDWSLARGGITLPALPAGS